MKICCLKKMEEMMNKTKRLTAADRERQIKSELPVCGMKQESEEVLASAGPGEGLRKGLRRGRNI